MHRDNKYIPFAYPLIYSLPGRCISECIFIVKDLASFLRNINTEPFTTTILPYDEKQTSYVVQMFVPCEDAKRLVRQARSLPCVIKAEVMEVPYMKMGWAIDLAFFPITIGRRNGLRLFNIVGEYFINAIENLKSMLGVVAEAFLYHLGFSYGERLAEGIMRILGIKETDRISEDLILKLALLFSHYARVVGAAIIEPLEINVRKYEVTFKMIDCWEAIAHLKLYGKSDKPVCYFTRGNIAGVASRVCGVKLKAIEEKCQAKGDPYCVVRLIPILKQI